MATVNARMEELERRLIANRRLMLGLCLLVLALIVVVALSYNRGDLRVHRLRVLDDRGDTVIYLKAAENGRGVMQVIGPKNRALIYSDTTHREAK